MTTAVSRRKNALRTTNLLPTVVVVVTVALLAGFYGAAAEAQEGPPGGLAGGVGIKITPTDVRHDLLEVDFDLTMYTRVGPYPSTFAGLPTFGYPAIDYGDGSTLPSTSLVLASTGSGPGGSNVYRNLASFTHTYPQPGAFTATAASLCTACVRAEYTFLYLGGTPTSLGPTVIDYRPTTVVGNLAGSAVYSGTVTTPFGSYLVRYLATYYPAVTNTTRVVVGSVLQIPTASTWGLVLLGGLLLLSGLAVLRYT